MREYYNYNSCIKNLLLRMHFVWESKYCNKKNESGNFTQFTLKDNCERQFSPYIPAIAQVCTNVLLFFFSFFFFRLVPLWYWLFHITNKALQTVYLTSTYSKYFMELYWSLDNNMLDQHHPHSLVSYYDPLTRETHSRSEMPSILPRAGSLQLIHPSSIPARDSTGKLYTTLPYTE